MGYKWALCLASPEPMQAHWALIFLVEVYVLSARACLELPLKLPCVYVYVSGLREVSIVIAN